MFYDVYLNLCNLKKIKPSKAAEEIGIDKSNVSQWKKNGYSPRGDAMLKIANYFGVSLDYLNGVEQKEKFAPIQKDELDISFDDFTYAFLDESKELTDENKAKLLEMAKFFKQQQEKEKSDSK